MAHLALFESWWPNWLPGQWPRSSAEELPGSVAGLEARNTQLVREVDELKSRLATAGSPNPTMRGSSSNERTKTTTRERADTKTGVSLGGATRRSAPDEAPPLRRSTRPPIRLVGPTDTPAASPTTEPYLKSGAQLYDALYRIGYHNGTRHHAGFLLRALDKMRRELGVKRGSSVLALRGPISPYFSPYLPISPCTSPVSPSISGAGRRLLARRRGARAVQGRLAP